MDTQKAGQIDIKPDALARRALEIATPEGAIEIATLRSLLPAMPNAAFYIRLWKVCEILREQGHGIWRQRKGRLVRDAAMETVRRERGGIRAAGRKIHRAAIRVASIDRTPLNPDERSRIQSAQDYADRQAMSYRLAAQTPRKITTIEHAPRPDGDPRAEHKK